MKQVLDTNRDPRPGREVQPEPKGSAMEVHGQQRSDSDVTVNNLPIGVRPCPVSLLALINRMSTEKRHPWPIQLWTVRLGQTVPTTAQGGGARCCAVGRPCSAEEWT